MTFTDYLKTRKLSPKTIQSYIRYQKIFYEWLNKTAQEPQNLSYSDLLNYLKYCRQKGFSTRYTNQLLGVLRHYYDYLKYTQKTAHNPAAGLHLKGTTRRIPHDLLSSEQLDQIYASYQQSDPAGKRNKIILGLIIYQALRTQELELLTPENLNLPEGKIYIPSSRRSQRRTLKLHASQAIALQNYLQKTRPQLLRISQKETAKLLFSTGQSQHLTNSIVTMMNQLRSQHAHLKNIPQLRQSRFAIWVKTHEIRHAQTLAGHKYVSSTERYESDNLADLQAEMDKHHPEIS